MTGLPVLGSLGGKTEDEERGESPSTASEGCSWSVAASRRQRQAQSALELKRANRLHCRTRLKIGRDVGGAAGGQIRDSVMSGKSPCRCSCVETNRGPSSVGVASQHVFVGIGSMSLGTSDVNSLAQLTHMASFNDKFRTLTGKDIELDIGPDFKVQRIKERVGAKQGISPPQQRLIYGDRQMAGGSSS